MADTTIKYFNSTMSGAPSMADAAGNLVAVLNACLVNGFGSVTLGSLVVASDVATGTLSTGHGFTMNGLTGPVITIAGATPAGLNGEWRIASIPGTTTFTFAVSGISDQTATGTITAKRSPAGWTNPYSGTNKAVYQRTAIDATAMVLRVDDTAAAAGYPTLMMYESMTGIDAGVGASLTAYTRRAAATNNPWRLVAGPLGVWFWTNPSATTWSFNGLSDLSSIYIPADIYACVLRGSTIATTAVYGIGASILGGSTCLQIARSETTIGGAQTALAYSHTAGTTSFGGKLQDWPSVDGRIHTQPVEAWSNVAARGLYPGIADLIHAAPATYDGTFIETDNGHTMLIQKLGSSATANACAVDITGPWS